MTNNASSTLKINPGVSLPFLHKKVCLKSRMVNNDKHKNNNMKKNSLISNFSVLPNHLIVEILARVAASSSNDFFNSKLICKEIYAISNDNYIYKKISLDRFPEPQWHSRKKVISFLQKCRESGNPEALFRRGVVEYFDQHKNMESSGLSYLKKSAKCGHLGASYVLGIILYCSGDKFSKQQGMELLDYVKVNKRLGYCRRKLTEIIRKIWLNRLRKIDTKPNSCGMQEKHRRKEGWPNMKIDDEDDKFGCNECCFNREVRLVSAFF